MRLPLLDTSAPDFERDFARLAARGVEANDQDVARAVSTILDEVRTRGDAALVELSRRFDQRPDMTVEDLEVSEKTVAGASAQIAPELRGALERAAERIRAFHRAQLASITTTTIEDGPGIRASLVVRPLDRVGIYVPGGTATYPSTVLMNAIPAKVAGVREVIMVTPARGGVIAPLVLFAAKCAEVDRIYSVGGAQAVGALALGTERIPPVQKIVGPGNAYVAEAKRQVFGHVAIDQIAGPSEVLIVADDSARPDVVAADALAQAEHDVRAAAIVVTWSADLAEKVAAEIARQCRELPRGEMAAQALEARGAVIVARSRDEALQLANRYAPEHLGLAVENAADAAKQITAAGAVFAGHLAPEALGDYNAGVNHVLPTGGTARFGSPLSVHDFIRRMSVLEVDAAGLELLGADALLLARAEGLEAHARAIEIRRARGQSHEEETEER